ncbi:MAG: hypothetical protein K0B05_04885 [Bacteroidales bacterium]|nr:hypothetical protein [Bacteroidales bacterium]
MKRFHLVLCLLFMCSLLKAQYSVNRKIYDYRTYSYETGDRYHPAATGVASLFIPGLGQIIMGETGRGVAFMGASAGFAALYTAGMIRSVKTIGAGISGDEVEEGGPFMFMAGGIGLMAVWIWSVGDAVRVAKVNNLAYRDANKTTFNIKLQPCIMLTDYNTRGSAATGLNLTISF